MEARFCIPSLMSGFYVDPLLNEAKELSGFF
jgi:hypothetical protein